MKRVGTGVARLDAHLGGGQPVRSTSLLLHDGRSGVPQELSRCFVGEGIATVSPVFFAYAKEMMFRSETEMVPKAIARRKGRVGGGGGGGGGGEKSDESNASGKTEVGGEKLKIAWRYAVDEKKESATPTAEKQEEKKSSFSTGSFGRRKKGTQSGSLLRKPKATVGIVEGGGSGSASPAVVEQGRGGGGEGEGGGSGSVTTPAAPSPAGNPTSPALPPTSSSSSSAATFVSSQAFDLTKCVDEPKQLEKLTLLPVQVGSGVEADVLLSKIATFFEKAKVEAGWAVPRIAILGLDALLHCDIRSMVRVVMAVEEHCYNNGGVAFIVINRGAIARDHAALLAHHCTIVAELRSLEANEALVLGADVDAIYTQRKGYAKALIPTTPNTTPMTMSIGRRTLDMDELSLPPELNASGGGSNAASGQPSNMEF